MPRAQDVDEVRILRFFEDEPLEKAELLFRIVAAKMKKRILPEKPSPKKKDLSSARKPGEPKGEEEVRAS